MQTFFLVSLCSVCKHLQCHCNFHCHFTCFPLFTFLQTTRFFMGLVFLESGAWYKVNRWVARYSPRITTTNQPTNSAPNEPARPICAQESIFWGKNWPFLGQNPKIYWRKQKFWYPHKGRPPRHLVRIFFLARHGIK